MRARYWIVLLLGTLLILPEASAQRSGRIFGVVVNASTGEPLADVNVFLSHTMQGAHTNASGQFEITGVAPGIYEMVATRIGYSPGVEQVAIASEGQAKQVDFRLSPVTYELKGVDVTAKRDRRWRQGFEQFVQLFLGDTPNAKETEILNPHVLSFETNPVSGVFHARTSEPIVLENRAMGYQLTFLLQSFALDPHKGVLSYSGRPFFSALQPKNETERARWEEIRKQTYLGSLAHLLASMGRGMPHEEGFQLWKDFMRQTQLGGRIEVDRNQMSQNMIDIKPLRLEEFLRETRPGEFEMQIREYIKVVYRGKVGREKATYRRDRTPDEQISWIVMEEPWAMLYRDGYVYPSTALRVHGFMAGHRVAELLPREYVLQQINLSTKPIENRRAKTQEPQEAVPTRPAY